MRYSHGAMAEGAASAAVAGLKYDSDGRNPARGAAATQRSKALQQEQGPQPAQETNQ